jgi:hypothetical protein
MQSIVVFDLIFKATIHTSSSNLPDHEKLFSIFFEDTVK